MDLVSSRYNFHEDYLSRIEPKLASEILAQVHVLHFPGQMKPWMQERSPKAREGLSLWWKARDNASIGGN
jgi:lipopolysaccharide biosynthesis glycosyltransferase